MAPNEIPPPDLVYARPAMAVRPRALGHPVPRCVYCLEATHMKSGPDEDDDEEGEYLPIET